MQSFTPGFRPELKLTLSYHRARLRAAARSIVSASVLLALATTCMATDAPKDRAHVIPAGTTLRIQLETRLSTGDNKVGDPFAGRVMNTVYADGQALIPEGSIIEGHVVHLRDARPLGGNSELLLRPDLLTTPEGAQYTLSADVTKTDSVTGISVGDEGLITGSRGPTDSDKAHVVIGAASGAVVGGLMAAGKGTLIGGGLGAAVVGGWWLLHRRHAELNPGAEITLRLDRALAVTSAPTALTASANPPTPAVPTAVSGATVSTISAPPRPTEEVDPGSSMATQVKSQLQQSDIPAPAAGTTIGQPTPAGSHKHQRPAATAPVPSDDVDN